MSWQVYMAFWGIVFKAEANSLSFLILSSSKERKSPTCYQKSLSSFVKATGFPSKARQHRWKRKHNTCSFLIGLHWQVLKHTSPAPSTLYSKRNGLLKIGVYEIHALSPQHFSSYKSPHSQMHRVRDLRVTLDSRQQKQNAASALTLYSSQSLLIWLHWSLVRDHLWL